MAGLGEGTLMGWTDLTTWNGNYQAVAFLNEFVTALNERRRAYGSVRKPGGTFHTMPAIDAVTVGADLQSWVGTFQTALIETLWGTGFSVLYPNAHTVGGSLYLPRWAATRNSAGDPITDYEGIAGTTTNQLQSIPWLPDNFYPAVTGDPAATGFRRYRTHPDAGGTPLYGSIQSGDIIGPWIFQDWQNALNLMTRSLHLNARDAAGYWYDCVPFISDTHRVFSQHSNGEFATLAEAQASWDTGLYTDYYTAEATSCKVTRLYKPYSTEYWYVASIAVKYALAGISGGTYLDPADPNTKWSSGPGVAGSAKLYFLHHGGLMNASYGSLHQWAAQGLPDCNSVWRIMLTQAVGATDTDLITDYAGDTTNAPSAVPTGTPAPDGYLYAGWGCSPHPIGFSAPGDDGAMMTIDWDGFAFVA